MKTNQVLVRHLGEFEVYQRTKDGMFNATALIKQWNEAKGDHKQIAKYFESSDTKEYIDTCVDRLNFTCAKSVYVKSRASRGDNAGTWMHPYLFYDFAMWLNPSFKFDVIKFVHDELLHYRNEAGDAYRRLSSAVAKIVTADMMRTQMPKVSEALNYIVFGKHEKMIRNTEAEEGKLRDLFELERRVSDNIEDGFIKNYDQLITYLRRQWYKRREPSVFAGKQLSVKY